LLNKINKDKMLKIPTKITQTNVLNGLLAIQTIKTKLNHALAQDVLMSKQMEMIAINVLLTKITKKMMEIKLKDNPALALAALLQTPMIAKFVLLITPMLLLKMDNNNKLANLPTQTPGTHVPLVTRTLEIKLKDNNKVNLPTQTPGTHVPLVTKKMLEIKLKDNNKLVNLQIQTPGTHVLLVTRTLEIKLMANPALVLAALLQTPMTAKFVLLITPMPLLKMDNNNKLANLPTQTPGIDVPLVIRIPKTKQMVNHVPVLTVLM
jgi:hypothetical protein